MTLGTSQFQQLWPLGTHYICWGFVKDDRWHQCDCEAWYPKAQDKVICFTCGAKMIHD